MDNAERPASINPSPSWIVRALRTPLSDALRGNFTGSLDARSQIVGAGLPIPVVELILRVVRDARLWRSERLDLARELVAHFTDGLAAGRTTAQLVADFGNPTDASRLIRNAKRRSRPLWWQAWWAGTRLCLLALGFSLLFYSAMAVRFYWGQPVLTHNYAAEINARRAVPEDQQAYTLYREGVVKLGRNRETIERPLEFSPGKPGWDKLVNAVEKHQPSVELAIAGSQRPRMGASLGGDARDNPELISVILEYVQDARELARLLAADARVAAAKDEAPRVTRDAVALMRIAEQLLEPPGALVEQLVAMAIFNVTTDTVGSILEDHPGLFSEAQLRDLAHRIAACPAGNPNVDFDFERMMFADALQRIYTDDGAGDGRVTSQGLQVLDSYMNYGDVPAYGFVRAASNSRALQLASYLVGPGIGALFGSRRENQRLYDELLDESTRLHRGNPWQWDQQAIAAAQDRFQREVSGSGRLRYAPVAVLAPQFSNVYDAAQRTIQQRDAALVAIALLIWHKRHEAWPTTLEELVPDLLPAVPVDRTTGLPLGYALHDGKPVVYALGNDRDDDSGHPAISDTYPRYPICFGRLTPAQSKAFQSEDNNGDWVLWPPSLQPKEDPPAEEPPAEEPQPDETEPVEKPQ